MREVREEPSQYKHPVRAVWREVSLCWARCLHKVGVAKVFES